MPLESDSNIEALLKAYAQKRRQAAGESLTLHPATRQLLQGEIALIYRSKNSNFLFPLARFLKWWPRLVLAVGIFVALALVVFSIMHTPSNISGDVKLAKNLSPAQAPVAAPKQVENEKLLYDNIPVAPPKPLTAPAIAPAQRSENLNRLNEKVVVTAAPAPTRVAQSTGSVEPTWRTLSRSLDAEVVQPKPLTSSAYSYTGIVSNTPAPRQEPTLRLRFAQMSLPNEAARRTRTIEKMKSALPQGTFPSSSPTSYTALVLTSFELERSGDKIQILDSDGSTYVGQIVPNPKDTMNRTSGITALGRRDITAQSEVKLESFSNTADKSTAPDSAVFYFRVGGTNRSLSQSVEINGQLIPASMDPTNTVAAIRSAPMSYGSLGTNASSKANSVLPSRLILKGQALVGGTNEVSIDAVSSNTVSPP